MASILVAQAAVQYKNGGNILCGLPGDTSRPSLMSGLLGITI